QHPAIRSEGQLVDEVRDKPVVGVVLAAAALGIEVVRVLRRRPAGRVRAEKASVIDALRPRVRTEQVQAQSASLLGFELQRVVPAARAVVDRLQRRLELWEGNSLSGL